MKYNGVNQVVLDLDMFSRHDMPGPFRMVVRGFSRYAETVLTLPIEERIKLVVVTDFVIESFLPGNLPITSMRLIGHADTDPVREQREPGFVQKISEKRAAEIASYLKKDITTRAWWASLILVPTGPRPEKIVLVPPPLGGRSKSAGRRKREAWEDAREHD